MNNINPTVFQELPEIIQTPLNHFEGRERDIVFLSLIGSLSAVMPNVIGEYDSIDVCPNLYFFIVAPPASGKGRVKFSKSIITHIFKEKNEDYKKELSEYKSELEKYEKAEDKKEIEKPQKPFFRPLLIPANTSVAQFEDFLDEQGNESNIIFETEADALTNIMKTEYGDYSTDLRNAFQHEPISKSRKGDREFRYIDFPKLSVVIVGTPDQVKNLMDTQMNGLFSRFNYYYFNDISDWRSVKPNPEKQLPKTAFNDLANKINILFKSLNKRANKIQFYLTDYQWDRLDETFSSIHDDLKISSEILSNVKRLGLNTFRMAMIFSIVRNYDKFSDSNTSYFISNETVTCEDIDFELALKVALSLLPNTQEILELYTQNQKFINSTEREFIQHFGNREFRTCEALAFAYELKIGRRTYFDYLNKWLNSGMIKKIRGGGYYKFI